MYIRKIKRRHLIYYLRVYDAANDRLIGHIADISTDGIMIISESSIAPDKEFVLKMIMPQQLEGTKELMFKASSLWSKKDVNPDFYANGFKIQDINTADRELIEYLIDEFGFRD
ncbi:MAG: PilZ domain-containing protein [Candidatus Omnitrophica bacterium]|nr:PilZ domain-containing protein [Candidatus Omnitrophota bacterium]